MLRDRDSSLSVHLDDAFLENSLEGITDEQFSVIRPYNLSAGMESISEVSEDDENWEEVSQRSKSSDSESSRVSQLHLSNSDVESELKFWSTAVYCYVLGANPPFKVIDGFVKRVWGYTDYDQLSFNSNGTFQVRFKTEEMKLRVLQSRPVFFNNKPVIVKEWTPDCKMIKESVDIVPIWIRFYGLPLTFWSNALLKIAALVGKTVRYDSNTTLKTFLGHARVMVEVKVGTALPDVIEFLDEMGELQRQIMHYEWRPIVCTDCNALGHYARDCKRNQTKKPAKKVWVPKKPGPSNQVPKVSNPVAAAPTVIAEPVEEAVVAPVAAVSQDTGLCGLIKTRVKTVSINKVHQGLGNNCKVAHNNSVHDGGMIWVIWDPGIFSVDILASEPQVIHSKVTSLQTGIVWWLSMVYGFNRVNERLSLWNSLSIMNTLVNGPWVVIGDFNNVLALNERLGSEVTNYEIRDFQKCVAECGLVDVPAQAAYFTWNNKLDPGSMVFSRIDRVMSNDEWLLQFPDVSIMFHPEGLFDHCPCTILLAPHDIRRKGNFKYFNMWGKDTISRTCPEIWDSDVEGYKMFQLVKKLKWLKLPLKRLNGSAFSNIETSAQVAQMHMFSMQKKLHDDPLNLDVHVEEKAVCESFKLLQEARRSFLSQKAKVQWMTEGDDNTNYFHKLLGTSKPVKAVHFPTVHKGRVVFEEQCVDLIKEVTAQEIHEALQAIPANKAPGPYGYTSQFFKDTKDIIGNDVVDVVQEFSVSGKLLKQINTTTLTLIPKKARPETSALTKGRDIVDNILICHDLVRLYKRKVCSPRCIMKVDLKKAYSSVEWKFIEQMLQALKFPDKMVKWIMECVSTPWFTISLNGSTFGYFQGKRGIRQGDPMSPLLFTIGMEYLSRVLNDVTSRLDFNYHPLCRPLHLTHLCFADDLFMFCRGDRGSITIILRIFATFSAASGLAMNNEKSEIYFNGMAPAEVDHIIQLSGFKIGTFPFRYLGIPISYKRMDVGDCTKLVEKVVGRIRVDHVYIKGKDWQEYTPTANSSWTWRKICQVRDILKPGFLNGQWIDNKGVYSVSSGYKWLCGQQSKVKWCPLIWNQTIIPKHSFISWLVVQERLMTRERLLNFGIITDVSCFFCHSHLETHQHLLYDCQFSKLCWALLCGWLEIDLPSAGLIDWCLNWRCKSLMKKQIVYAAIVAVWYHIWNARNVCRLEAMLITLAALITKVKLDITRRCKDRI
ncbi:uncharacterized protein LOC141639720 [Silene latifolia]|uniref:uncharacterized protein LOC141639720 n=1 Tax=Silene latifolia TaxID=37657 RepID=UPI003D785BE7